MTTISHSLLTVLVRARAPARRNWLFWPWVPCERELAERTSRIRYARECWRAFGPTDRGPPYGGKTTVAGAVAAGECAEWGERRAHAILPCIENADQRRTNIENRVTDHTTQ